MGTASEFFKKDKIYSSETVTYIQDLIVESISNKMFLAGALMFYDSFWKAKEIVNIMVDNEGNFVMANDAWCNAMGYDILDLVGKKFTSFMHEDDIDRTVDSWQRAQAGGNIDGLKNRYLAKDGSIVHITWSLGYSSDHYSIGSGRITINTT